MEDENMTSSRMIYQAGIHWRHGNRYDYHHHSRTWNTRHSRNDGDDYFCVTLILESEERATSEQDSVSYLIPTAINNSRHFPLRELMYTFAEQVGVGVEQLEFRRHEEGNTKELLVPMMIATPDSLGMTENQDFVIVVSIIASNHDKRVRSFKMLNRMGKVTIGMAPQQGRDVFGTDLLPRILEFAGIEFLVSACQVCRHWFHVCQRYSVLVQLQDGHTDTWQYGQQYPVLLHDKCRPSFNYYLTQCQEMGHKSEESRLGRRMIQKEKTIFRAFGYCRTDAKRTCKSVYMERISRGLDYKWHSLNNAKSAFLEQVTRHSQYEVRADFATAPQQYRTALQRQTPNRLLMISSKSNKGYCIHCGVKTHNIGVFRKVPLTNDNVYQGICIRCNPLKVPRKVLFDLGILIPRKKVPIPEQRQEQEFPPEGEAGNGFIAEANDWRYKNCAVELYRRYFNPNMHYIFPLIVNQEAAFGFDFRSCTTTTSLIFGTPSDPPPRRRPATRQERLIETCLLRNWRDLHGDETVFLQLLNRTSEGLKAPLGAVSWRIHDAEEVASKAMVGLDKQQKQQEILMTSKTPKCNAVTTTMINGSRPQIVLEVLFLAVWDMYPGGYCDNYKSALVTSLESQLLTYAKDKGHKSALMYVEIGLEQPWTNKFWVNSGFAPIASASARKGKGKDNSLRVDENVLTGRIVELEDWQLGFIDRRCLRFKDTQQYAKRVLVG